MYHSDYDHHVAFVDRSLATYQVVLDTLPHLVEASLLAQDYRPYLAALAFFAAFEVIDGLVFAVVPSYYEPLDSGQGYGEPEAEKIDFDAYSQILPGTIDRAGSSPKWIVIDWGSYV